MERVLIFVFFNQKTADERRISDWSSDVCSSDLWTRPGKSASGAARHDQQHWLRRRRRDRQWPAPAVSLSGRRPCRKCYLRRDWPRARLAGFFVPRGRDELRGSPTITSRLHDESLKQIGQEHV